MIRRILYILFIPLMVGCSHARIDEAERTLTMADSLRAAGQAYNDSLRLSEAFQTFRARRLSYPDEYARIGYYYGRHLRAVGDYPAAMQAFIAATHAYSYLPFHSRDYEILGRVYSNMGSLCHLEGDYALSQEMFLLTAAQFERSDNRLVYYYALNEAALELAEQTKEEEVYQILSKVGQECNDCGVYSYIYQTHAVLCKNLGRFDSAIMYVNKMQEFGNRTPLGYVLKAQSFWSLSQFDSAIYYAKYIMGRSDASPQDQYNMLYILAYNDSTIDNEQIKRYTEDRGDIGIDIDKQHQSLAHAIALLEQELSRPVDWRWLYMLIALIALVGTALCLRYILLRHRILRMEKTLFAQNKLTTLEQLITALHSMPTEQIAHELCWRNFNLMCQIINARMNGLIDKLSQSHPNLTKKEVRLCVLVLIDLSRKQMAELLTYAENGIGKFKYSTAQKMGTTSLNMRAYLLQIIS